LGIFWKSYIGQAVGSEWDITDLIGEQAAIALMMEAVSISEMVICYQTIKHIPEDSHL
jgi:hypothetical protein